MVSGVKTLHQPGPAPKQPVPVTGRPSEGRCSQPGRFPDGYLRPAGCSPSCGCRTPTRSTTPYGTPTRYTTPYGTPTRRMTPHGTPTRPPASCRPPPGHSRRIPCGIFGSFHI